MNRFGYISQYPDWRLKVFERYDRARNNDMKYIEELVSNAVNPLTLLNDTWDGTGKSYWRKAEESILVCGKIIGTTGITLVGINIAAPIALPFIVVGQLLLMRKIVIMDNEHRKGWRLLDFAAEGGAGEVAAYLILKGATSNNYIKIANDNNHGRNFVATCRWAESERSLIINAENIKRTSVVKDKALEKATKEAREAIIQLETTKKELLTLQADFTQLAKCYMKIHSAESPVAARAKPRKSRDNKFGLFSKENSQEDMELNQRNEEGNRHAM